MSITIKPSQKFGGNGGINLDDFSLIINDQSFSGIAITKILVRKIEAHCENIVAFIQFTYYIETIKGSSAYEFSGNKYGKGGGDTLIKYFTYDEQVTGISGRYGPYANTSSNVILNLEFYTSKNNTISCGKYSSLDTPFTLPVGVFYGSSDDYLNTLSCTTGILGFCFLVAIGIFLWKKFRSLKGPKPIPTPSSSNY
ncbi:1242_t:CDS:2 [Rhizophagus irregularis]|nr:1242_t:CDS:2 [Rhizophagus irregularis]